MDYKHEPIANGIAPINYPDDSGLRRPQVPPAGFKKSLFPSVVAALIVGAFIVIAAVSYIIIMPAIERNTIKDYCLRDVSYNFPSLAQCFSYSNEEALQWTTNEGYTVCKVSSDDEIGLDFYRAPGSLEANKARSIVKAGLTNVSATDLALFLNGSWRMTYDREGTYSLRVRYADFKSGSIDNAMNAAIQQQGLTGATVTSTGIDNNLNTYIEGTLALELTEEFKTLWNATDDSQNITWRISCIELNEVYPQQLTDLSYYVGIRFTLNTKQ